MKRYALLVAVLGFAAASAFSDQLGPLNEHIAVSSTAAPDYQREVVGQSGPKPQGYVFTPGRFFESGTRDRGLERTSFTELVRKLAPDLARQNFFPTKDPASADLVIVVHWGATLVYDDPRKDANLEALNVALPAYATAIANDGFADPGAMNEISDSLVLAQENSSSALARNAVLLGYAQELKKFGPAGGLSPEREKTLRAELSEERYFVVLMAYDYQALKKDKVSKLRWVTRLSVRTAGNNFTEALPVLCQAGSHVFGKQMDDLVHLKANLREGRVSLGELKVVGVTDAAPAGVKP
jgi:hypothetical protein